MRSHSFLASLDIQSKDATNLAEKGKRNMCKNKVER
jgi:hypothetical protein